MTPLGPSILGAILALAAVVGCGSEGIGKDHSPVSGGSDSMAFANPAERDSSAGVLEAHGLPAEVLASVLGATFQVTGLGCTKAQFGTAFVVGEGTLVTNAHVVAGIWAPQVTVGEQAVAARVVAFDPVADLAVLVVDRSLPAPLPLGNAVPGAVGALFGYDHGGVPVIRPARVDQEILATGKDIYGEPAKGRRALMVDAQVDTGFSGGPIVDRVGSVVGVLFSRARGGGPEAYAIQTGEVLDLLDKVGSSPEGPGPCL